MADQVTFIHAADLHLGAPMRGLRALSESWADRVRSAIAEAYGRVVQAALDRQVDFVLIAGDMFDTACASYADYRLFFRGLDRLSEAGIPVFMVTGNHDPYTSWKSEFFNLPEGVFMLSAQKPDFRLVRRDGIPLCLVGGRGYYNQTWPQDLCIADGVTRAAAEEALAAAGQPDAAQAPFAVGMLHCGLHLDSEKAPVSPRQLLGAGMDYWALGHIHLKGLFPSEANPRIGFSGCIQGRDIRETDERGIYCVTLRGRSAPEVEFIPTASIVWQRLDVDVSECESLPAVGERVMRELFHANGRAHCEEMVSRITLTGSTKLHGLLARDDVREDIRESLNDQYPLFFCDALLDATRPVRDEAVLREEGLFPATFLGVADAQADDEEGLLSYVQEEFLNRGVKLPGSVARSMDELARDARLLVLDVLLSEEAS